MGQVSRMNRADRFIKAFQRFIVSKLAIKKGDVLTVTDVFLSSREGSGEEVVDVIKVKLNDTEMEVLLEGGGYCIFDPEYDQAMDCVERMEGYDIPPEEAKRLLIEADLFREGDFQ